MVSAPTRLRAEAQVIWSPFRRRRSHSAALLVLENAQFPRPVRQRQAETLEVRVEPYFGAASVPARMYRLGVMESQEPRKPSVVAHYPRSASSRDQRHTAVATLSLIASFGACTRSCFVPR
jgi:hypothetical protein